MGIGSLGLSELVVIFVIVLVFFGPRRFPEIARSMGHAMREFRRSLNQIQRELEDADPRSSIPGRDFLNDLGKPGRWMDPNRSHGREAAKPPPGSRTEAAEPYPVRERPESDESEEQLPIFEDGEPTGGDGTTGAEGGADEPDPRTATGDRPAG